MTDATPQQRAPGQGRTRWSRAACVLCGLQCVGLLAATVFYLVELARGEGSNPTQVLMSAVLIVVFAALLGLLAWLWWRGSPRAGTPTLVWCAVLGVGLVTWGLDAASTAVLALAAVTFAVALADSTARTAAIRRG